LDSIHCKEHKFFSSSPILKSGVMSTEDAECLGSPLMRKWLKMSIK
jgi:hypothetical protein